jgi:hypothetical protein
MKLNFSIRTLATSWVAAAFLAISPAYANDAPQVVVNGINAGKLMFNGPVQFSGVTADANGIARIFGTLQDTRTQLFYTPQGEFVKDPTQLPFQYRKNVKKTTWSTPGLRVPPGNYMFRIIVEDARKVRTEKIEIPTAVRRSGAATAATAATATRQPAAQQPAAKPAATTGTMAANGMPYCSNAGMDADKDGYGWENEKSCVVAGSNADKHPNCASAASDPDGDGWGWENERSCIVVTRCQSANSDPDGDGWGWENDKSCIVVKTSGKHPQCASATSDPDGDGYGWENNATCLVAK